MQSQPKVSGERCHHLARVLGFQAGDSLIAADGQGNRFRALIQSVDKDTVSLKLSEQLPPLPPEPVLRLMVAPPKGKAFDLVLDFAAQLGIKEIVPVITRRTVVRWDDQSWKSKSARFERLLIEAASQCNRPGPPKLSAPLVFEQALSSASALQVLAWEVSEEASQTVFDSLFDQEGQSIDLWIGPEGGFEPEEAQALKKNGALEVSLGKALLRVPVAVVALVSRIQAAWERKQGEK